MEPVVNDDHNDKSYRILANPLESWLDECLHPGGTNRKRRQRQRILANPSESWGNLANPGLTTGSTQVEPVVNDNNDNESQRILANPGEDIEFANLSSIAHLRKGELPRWSPPYSGANPTRQVFAIPGASRTFDFPYLFWSCFQGLPCPLLASQNEALKPSKIIENSLKNI